MLTSYRKLDVWKRSLDRVANVYRVTSTLPAAERFGLTAQMRRAAVSVSCNIAEGYGTNLAQVRQMLGRMREALNERKRSTRARDSDA